MKKDYFQILRTFEGSDQSHLQEFFTETAQAINEKEWTILEKVFDQKFEAGNVDPGGDFYAIANSIGYLAFGTGFIFGQMFHPTGKEARAAVKELRQRLISEGLLKFESKEKN